MEKHFCNCNATQCPNHPCNHDKGCDLCIQKNLKMGEIPACFWLNVSNGVEGNTKYSVDNFTQFYLENKNKNQLSS